MNKKSIGIILTYNSAKTLPPLLARIPSNVLDQLIVSDDASTDNTMAVARQLGLPAFSHPHSGYGGNMKFGLEKALAMGADFMFEIHGDGQYDPAALPTAVKKLEEGYDLVLGSRFETLLAPLKNRMPLLRYLANIGLSFTERIMFNLRIQEFHTGFRCYSRRLLETIPFREAADDHLFSFQTIVQTHFCGLPIAEIPIHCDYKQEHSSIGIGEGVVFSLQTFAVAVQFNLAKYKIKNSKIFTCYRRNNTP